MAEEEGTFTNLRGRVQRYLQAKRGARHVARPRGGSSVICSRSSASRTSFFVASEAFAALAAAHPEFAGMSYDTLGTAGTARSRRQPAAQEAAR